MESKGVKASSSAHLMASYTDRNPALRILATLAGQQQAAGTSSSDGPDFGSASVRSAEVLDCDLLDFEISHLERGADDVERISG
jgi:hypothetical protein